ncbi:MAG: D-alanine--D-alanine ligase, partial [Chloroflexota bacterium]|nr:D-alanine--D-alanine ligase [Chloroflexota bacterium]
MAGRRLRVGVLFGGRSSEHEVSLQSARAVMDALGQAGHEVVPIGISKTGRFLVGGDPLRALSSGDFTGERSATMLPEPGGDHRLQVTSRLDVLFPVLHGTFGEDGTLQGLFELAAVPYAGAGVLGSALGMDKVVQKTLWRGLNLPVVDFASVLRCELERDEEGVLHGIEAAFGYPCFTKPANLGSSVGVRKARDCAELRAGLAEAARFDAKLVVERALDARELECGVLGNDDPITSVVGEIVPGAEFYDYRAKYLDTGSRAIIPAEIPSALADEVRRMALAAFKAVDAAGLARVDFFLERTTGRVYLNEINTMPGFT